MKKLLGISLFFLLSLPLWGQLRSEAGALGLKQKKLQLSQLINGTNFSQQIQYFTLKELSKHPSILSPSQQQPNPAAYAYKDLAFFCKIEVQLEKAVKLPVKFRLGSVDYVDYLEGKRANY